MGETKSRMLGKKQGTHFNNASKLKSFSWSSKPRPTPVWCLTALAGRSTLSPRRVSRTIAAKLEAAGCGVSWSGDAISVDCLDRWQAAGKELMQHLGVEQALGSNNQEVDCVRSAISPT